MTAIHLDRFSSGLDDLTRKQQADHIAVLRVLAKTGRYSIFEATENQTIARTIDRLITCDWITFPGNNEPYPWTTVALTEAGKRLIEDKPE